MSKIPLAFFFPLPSLLSSSEPLLLSVILVGPLPFLNEKNHTQIFHTFLFQFLHLKIWEKNKKEKRTHLLDSSRSSNSSIKFHKTHICASRLGSISFLFFSAIGLDACCCQNVLVSSTIRFYFHLYEFGDDELCWRSIDSCCLYRSSSVDARFPVLDSAYCWRFDLLEVQLSQLLVVVCLWAFDFVWMMDLIFMKMDLEWWTLNRFDVWRKFQLEL